MTRADHLARLPLVAILRGLVPSEAVAIGATLVEAGFAAIEVPLNSPQRSTAFAALSRRVRRQAAIGAGTVLDAGAVAAVA